MLFCVSFSSTKEYKECILSTLFLVVWLVEFTQFYFTQFMVSTGCDPGSLQVEVTMGLFWIFSILYFQYILIYWTSILYILKTRLIFVRVDWHKIKIDETSVMVVDLDTIVLSNKFLCVW